MEKSVLIRRGLLLVSSGILLSVIVCVARPVLVSGENELQSLVHAIYFQEAAIVQISWELAIAHTLFVFTPVMFVFLLIDLYCLRNAPVEHLGCFAVFLIAALLVLCSSLVMWLTLGGWGPPVVVPVVGVIFSGMSLAAIISEYRIYQSGKWHPSVDPCSTDKG